MRLSSGKIKELWNCYACLLSRVPWMHLVFCSGINSIIVDWAECVSDFSCFTRGKAVPASETPCFNPNEIEKTHIRVTSGTHRSYQP